MSAIEFERRELEMKSLKKKRKWLDGTKCPFCNGKIKVISMYDFYGVPYGYNKLLAVCTTCQARTGIRVTNSKGGLIATRRMRKGRMICHSTFDKTWKKGIVKREELYGILAKKMGIPKTECHFSLFSLTDLRKAYRIISKEDWYIEVKD